MAVPRFLHCPIVVPSARATQSSCQPRAGIPARVGATAMRFRRGAQRVCAGLRGASRGGTLALPSGVPAPGEGNRAMLLNRSEISADKAFDLFTDAILQRDQAKTTDLFHKLVRDGRSIGDALSLVTAAEAP